MGSISGSINFQGISGTDFGTMVDGLKEAELIPKMQLESWHNDWEKRYDAFEDLLVGFKDLQTALKELNTIGKIIQKEVASSEDSVATAKADSNAENGTTSVTVNKLATNSAYSFQGQFDKDTVVTDFSITQKLHDFTYIHDGEEHTVSVPTGTTIEGLMNEINRDPTNPGVSASLVKNGDKYNFQLQSDETGLDSELVFDHANNDDFIDFGAVNHRPAQDAEFYLNGWDTNILTSGSNQLEEVVTGLDITLISVGTSELTVTQSTEGIKEKVTEFVDATNKLLKMFEDFTAIEEAIEGTSTDTATDEGEDEDSVGGTGGSLYNPQGGVLTGNYGIQMLESQLKSILGTGLTGSSYYDPLTGTGDEFRTLASIGIITDHEQGSETYGQLIFIEDDEDDEDKADLDPARKATLDFVKEYENKNAVVIDGVKPDPDATPPIVGDPPVPFKYTYKDVEHTVQVPAGSTLEELMKAINDDPNNEGVTATAVSSGTGVKFRLSGDDKGADADLTVDRNQTGVNVGGYLKTDPKDASKDPFRTLDDILEDDPLAVANLLSGTKTSSTSNYFSYSSSVENTTEPGIHEVTYDTDEDGNPIESTVMIGGYLAAKNPDIEGAWNAKEGPAAGLRIMIGQTTANPKNSTINGSINMQEGKILELEKFLTKESKPGNSDDAADDPNFEKGSLHILKDNYEDIMDNIQKKIESEVARVERWEVVQRAHYARLDALLMDYQNKMNSNASSLSKLAPIS